MSQVMKKKSEKSFILKFLHGPYKGKQLKLLSSKIKIGRAKDCDIIFKDDSNCSRHHAQIQKQNSAFFIQSLNSKNPVIVNKKAIESQILKSKDSIQIGKTKMVFLEQKDFLNSSRPAPSLEKKTNLINFPRLVLIFLLLLGAFLFVSKEKTKKQAKQNFQLGVEEDILNQTEKLKDQEEEALQNLELSFKQETARAAFIAGFRDYRKGYFHRALKFFRHCSILDKGNDLCRRYELKSNVQIEKLIQKKIRLGNSYKANKQYRACEAAFKSVETMLLDISSPIYKTAQENRISCAIHLRNKI